MRSSSIFGLAAVLLLAGATPVLAQKVYNVGVYLPNTRFSDSAAQGSFASRVAKGLSDATGLQFRGRSYGSAGALKSAIGRGLVDFAILDALYFASNMAYRPLASGGPRETMSLLVSKGFRSVAELKGKVLVTPQSSSNDANFYANYILSAEVIAKSFFSKVLHRSNISAAITMVSTGRADAVFAYARYAGGLRVLFSGRKVPAPVFVLVNKSLDNSIVAKVRSGLGRAGGGLFRWGAYDGAGIKAIRGAMMASTRRLSTKRPVMAVPKPANLTLRKESFRQRFNYVLPGLRALFVTPTASVSP